MRRSNVLRPLPPTGRRRGLDALVASAGDGAAGMPGPGVDLLRLSGHSASDAWFASRLAERTHRFTDARTWATFETGASVAEILTAAGGTLVGAHAGHVYAWEATDWFLVLECDPGWWRVDVAATAPEAADRVLGAIDAFLPPDNPVEGEVSMAVWTEHPMGGGMRRWARCSVGAWVDVQANYPEPVAAQLTTLAAGVPTRESGGMVVFTGPAGTGKTRAIEALMAAWAPHTDLSVVADADRMLGSASYLTDVLTAADQRRQIVVAEDGDELLAAGPKGHEVAKLLNMTDGIIGRLAGGAGTLLVLSANLERDALASYVERPGRTVAVVDFTRFDQAGATAWLRARTGADDVELAEQEEGWSLAELYQRLAAG